MSLKSDQLEILLGVHASYNLCLRSLQVKKSFSKCYLFAIARERRCLTFNQINVKLLCDWFWVVLCKILKNGPIKCCCLCSVFHKQLRSHELGFPYEIVLKLISSSHKHSSKCTRHGKNGSNVENKDDKSRQDALSKFFSMRNIWENR